MKESEFNERIGTVITSAREKHGVTLSALAEITGIDRRRLQSFEKGRTCPTVAEYASIFYHIGDNALRPTLDILFPDIYGGLSSASTSAELRTAIGDFVLNQASDRIIRQMCFLMFGEHGSNFEAQMQEMVMVDHMPMDYRYTIASNVYSHWEMAKGRDEIVYRNNVMPDEDMFLRAYSQGRDAAFKHQNSYASSMKEREN